tara:strand:- start:2800 stop:4716 length:1917 start_codon:yes stop_codon:yes gene_type:complete
MRKKKKILIHSNHCRVKTGFGKHMKHLLAYLHKTKKYEVIEFANGKQEGDPSLNNLPWTCIGSLPSDPNLVRKIKSDDKFKRTANYGHLTIDKVIENEKPDIYLGIEDVWGLEPFFTKKWWSNIHSLIWTPIDSLPLLDKHILAASKTKNVIVQASFAEKALKEEGFNNTHLLPVPIDSSNFFKMDQSDIELVKQRNNIDLDDFIIGFVFRNQLRKSVPNLLEGFKQFIDKNPSSNAKLLLHTHWGEGWDISKLINEKNIDPQLILTTYYCDNCKQYEIKSFAGQNLDCKFCGSKKSQQTTQIHRGVSESQLNEIYNLMDLYCHPFTSGGQEIPIQEAKLTELITLVTNYSCGEDYCSEESGGLPLDWSEYREPGTQFIKASTDSNDICKNIELVYNMLPKEKDKMGKKARKFIQDFCSIDNVCSQFESIISKLDPIEWDFDMSFIKKNINFIPENIEENESWLLSLYKGIFDIDPKVEDKKGVNHWLNHLNQGGKRQEVYDHFIKLAKQENARNISVPFESLLDESDSGKRILFALPEDDVDVFNSTSLLRFIKDRHPDFNIYYATKPEYFDILNGNPYVHKVIQYNDVMDNALWSEGQVSHQGFFNFSLIPYTNTHKYQNFIHGNQHAIPYNLNYA